MTEQSGERKQARKTALVVGLVFAALAAWSLWRAHPLRAAILASAGALLLLMAAAAPRWTIPFHRTWMKLAGALGYVNSRILLGLLYYGVMTPLGLLRRLLGRDPLRRRGAPAESYWIPRARTRQDRQRFERLF